jgi:metal-responsive CopG/Arc/MetJ family transcriptional regulator
MSYKSSILIEMPGRTPKKLVAVRLNVPLSDAIDRIAADIGRSRTEIIHRAIEDYVAKNDPAPSESRPKPKR